jgi:hypothetical protein
MVHVIPACITQHNNGAPNLVTFYYLFHLNELCCTLTVSLITTWAKLRLGDGISHEI